MQRGDKKRPLPPGQRWALIAGLACTIPLALLLVMPGEHVFAPVASAAPAGRLSYGSSFRECLSRKFAGSSRATLISLDLGDMITINTRPQEPDDFDGVVIDVAVCYYNFRDKMDPFKQAEITAPHEKMTLSYEDLQGYADLRLNDTALLEHGRRERPKTQQNEHVRREG